MGNAPIISAAIALAVAVFGALTQHVLQKRREEWLRGQAAALGHLQSQIQELYGPLHGMTQRLSKIYDVVCQKLPTTPDGAPDPAQFDERAWEITTFFIDAYFLPLHTQVDALIRTKMHLLEPGGLPVGFEQFFDHEARFECLYRLWKEKGIPWEPTIDDVRWPKQFEQDVESILDRLRTRQQQYLRDIKGT